MSDVRLDTSTVIHNIQQLTPRMKIVLNNIGNTVGEQMQTYAQLGGRWTDRTGDAREGLNHNVQWDGTTLDISVYHTMDYGLFLETRQDFNGKYKILEEARDSQIELFKSMLQAARF